MALHIAPLEYGLGKIKQLLMQNFVILVVLKLKVKELNVRNLMDGTVMEPSFYYVMIWKLIQKI
jgi:hypothetical protein